MTDTPMGPVPATRRPPERVCAAHRKVGDPCRQPAIKGTEPARCHYHSGKQQKGREVRALVSEWRLGDPTLDPLQVMAATCTAAWMEFARVSDELDRLIEHHGSLEQALVGDSMIAAGERAVKSGEYIRGLPQLKLAWWDRASRSSEALVKAGVAERQVRVLEAQAALLVQVVRGSLAELGVSVGEAAVVAVVARQMRQLDGPA